MCTVLTQGRLCAGLHDALWALWGLCVRLSHVQGMCKVREVGFVRYRCAFHTSSYNTYPGTPAAMREVVCEVVPDSCSGTGQQACARCGMWM
jgi:hypothetical protein